MTYLLTFACYGSHLPGQEGSVDRRHNLPGSSTMARNPGLLRATWERMKQPPFRMQTSARAVVLEALVEVCWHKGWRLLAAHVRTNHVHLVLDAEVSPEAALNAFKAYASQRLNSVPGEFEVGPGIRRWARHGSTRYLWTRDQIDAAIRYVLEKQGEPMAVWQAPARSAP